MGPFGFQELLLVFFIALIVFGPRKLPEIGRTIGKTLGEFRRATHDLKSTLEEEVRKEEQQGPATFVRETSAPAPAPPASPTVSRGTQPAAEPDPRASGVE